MSDKNPTLCTEVINAGPGHQSRHECVRSGEHHHHNTAGHFYYEWSTCQKKAVEWSDEPQAFSGVFNESPGHCEEHDDDE